MLGSAISLIISNDGLIEKARNSSNNYINNTEENEEAETIEEMYITQDSNISPTGKEFVGIFSQFLKNYYDESYKNSNYINITTYDTSIDNIKAYAIEAKTDNNVKGIDEFFYYNESNNHFIGAKQVLHDVRNIVIGLNNNGSNYEDFVTMGTNNYTNFFMNYHNMSESEKISDQQVEWRNKWENFTVKVTPAENTLFNFNGYECYYRVLGYDYIIANVHLNSNSEEFLYLAYDKNTNPEETIKQWYNKVYIIEQEKSNTEQGNINNNKEGSSNSNIIEDKNNEKEQTNDNKKIENTYSNSNNNVDTQKTNGNNNIKIPSLYGKTKEEAIKTVEQLGVDYEITNDERLHQEEGIVINQYINKKGILCICINKYKDITVQFKIDEFCLVRQYQEECEKNNISPKNDKYIFKLLINDKYNKEHTFTKEEFEKKNMLDCGIIMEEYTGHGKFNFKLFINDIKIRDCQVNVYQSEVINNFSEYMGESYIYPQNSNIIQIWSGNHGGAG